MSLNSVLEIAGSALTAQSKRLNITASNIANADSAVASNGEPYKARRIVFTPIAARAAEPMIKKVAVTAIVEDKSPPRMVYNPNHPLADGNGYVTMPNINPVEEMTDMISASRSYQTSVEMMNTTKQLLQKTLSIGQN